MMPAALTALVGLFVWSYYPVAAVQYRETRACAQLSAELASLQARNARLSKQVDRLKTPAGVEDYARSQLGMVKKGENVVVVVDGQKPATTAAYTTAPRIDSGEMTATVDGPWTAFLDLVFGVQ